jgi:hypothetical protein
MCVEPEPRFLKNNKFWEKKKNLESKANPFMCVEPEPKIFE